MILEQLVSRIRMLWLGSAKPKAIWFVDRQEEYYQLLRTSDSMLNPLTPPLRFYGLPLHTVNTSFTKEPGIWIEMSDGSHVKVTDEPLA